MKENQKSSLGGQFVIGNDLPIKRLGFGAMRVTGPGIWGYPKDLKEAHRLLRRTIELGINFFDTADSYGPEVSEKLIAEALYPYPPGLVIATKGGLTRPGADDWIPNGRPEYLRQCIEKSLSRLKLDCIDLYQLHAVDSRVPIEKSLEALKEMQQQGKIRHIGLSNVSITEIERAKKIVHVVSVQNLYNLLNRESEPVLDYCEKNNIAFIPWFPLAKGDLVNSGGILETIAIQKGATIAQVMLAWLLKRSSVMIPIPGTSSIKHLEENVSAAKVELSDTEYAQLAKLFTPFKMFK